MSFEPQVSVLINNYNYERFLPQAIETALRQEGVHAEVIVVDDGSKDGSRAVIEGYGDRVKAVFQENGGQASAINAGVANSRAPVLAFLDADDWWAPTKLRETLHAFAENPDAGLVYHRLQPVHLDGSNAFAPIPRSLCAGEMAPRLKRSGGCWPFPMTSSLAVTRAAWDAAGAIPDSFRISADAWLTGILPFLSPVVALPQALGYYRIHNNNWYRATEDEETLVKRMSHWRATVDVSNQFLAEHGRQERLDIADHFPYQAAAARLGTPDANNILTLVVKGLRDPGEPNVLRRARTCARLVAQLRRDPLKPASEMS
jgi:glycosyltransferase involved in cell wall biosynthesis